MENTEDLFDYDWVKNYESDEKQYSTFYEKDINTIKVNCLYVNKRNELEKITEKPLHLNKSNLIEKTDLIKIIKQNDILDNIKYKLISILVYNFNLENDDLKYFLKSPEDFDLITNLKNIDDYRVDTTIEYFHKINNIYIIFNVEEKKSKPNTKRVRFNLPKGRTKRRK